MVLDDGLAERAPFDGTPGGLTIGGKRNTEGLGGHQDASDIEGLERQAQRAIHLTDPRAVRHRDIELQVGGLGTANAHLVGQLVDDRSGLLLVDHEG
jgi:hypothetical protein